MFTKVMSFAYSETLVKGLPFDPSHGKWETAAEMILSGPTIARQVCPTVPPNRKRSPSLDLKDFKNCKKLSESLGE
jgi:hypothetical protein